MTMKQLLISLMSLILLVVLLPATSAFGIAPGKTIVEFTPNAVSEHEIILINTEQETLTITLEATGDLASYIQLSKTQVTLAPDTSLTVPYTLRLPAGFPQSGSVTGMIIAHRAQQGSSDKTNPSIHVGAVAGVASVIQVNVPYQGRTLEARVYVAPTEAYQPVEFLAQAKNVGMNDISNLRIQIAIYDTSNTLLTTLSSEEKKLKTRERTDIVTVWDPHILYGDYHAVITFLYNGRKQESALDFTVGRFPIELTDLRIEHFIFGAQADILAALLNKETRDVTVTSTITLQETTLTSPTISLDSQTITLSSQQDKTLVFPWNLANLTISSKYKGTFSLTVEETTSVRTFYIDLTPEGASASFAPFSSVTGQTILLEPTTTNAGNTVRATLIIILFIVLVNIIVLSFWYSRRKKSTREQPPLDNTF